MPYIDIHIPHQVDTPTGSSTVYVHGFGTDDSYHAPYGHGHAYGYGHIDPYLNHKQVVVAAVVVAVVKAAPPQGYGYTAGPGYGYNGVAAYPGHGPHHGHHGHGAGPLLGVPHGLQHGVGVAHHAAGPHLAHHGAAHGPAYGPGYGAPQPFVGSGFRWADAGDG